MSAARVLPSLAPDRARRLIADFSGRRVLVVGDVMLDHFLVGRVSRISPEAPVPVVNFDHETHRLGGAANVAHSVAALGGQVDLVGVTGRDDAVARLTEACLRAGIHAALVSDDGRRTTTKMRIVTERNQQVARVDYESEHEITGAVEDAVLEHLRALAATAHAVIVSDYLKGCITPRVMREVVAIGAERAIPVVVDPKIPHLDYYAGATLITPNHHEAESATHRRIRARDDAREAARVFRDRARCGAVLITRGDQGMWLLDRTTDGYLPASAREVADVTGAGDTVIATLALALATGATPSEAARLANEAAGIVVGKFGPSVVSPVELLHALDAAARV